MQYNVIGFKAGLEIHQQLDTHKLFCNCPSTISEEADVTFKRLLRPTQSELGDVDRAALEEAARHRRFLYRASDASTCLVEADEEPPHATNPEAIDVCLTVALLLDARPVDEIQFMRKIVIDGSNTTGFQRTALVALGGILQNVRISTIALEEDAARKITEKDNMVYYGLDRLGIPLIEITTEADITSPDHAKEMAEQLGRLLQATKKVKRGLGTIRQDLNISIAQGARVEVKGIQSLSSISKVAENEALRQKGILDIREILRKRGEKCTLEKVHSKDLSRVLLKTQSKVLQDQLKQNRCIKGIRLPGFHGLLEKQHTRLGKDFTIYAGVVSGIKIVIHSEEILSCGISEQEIHEVKQQLQVGTLDAFVLAVGDESMVDTALHAVLQRALMYYDGVPEEVRRSLPDNTTEYMRPLPGAARMYPETDVPPVRITQERVQKLQLPEKPAEKRQRLSNYYHLNEEQLNQLLFHGREQDFERHITQYPDMKNIILRTYLNTLPELEKEGLSLRNADETLLSQVFSTLQQGRYAKEAAPTIIRYLLVHPDSSVEDAIQACGLRVTGDEEIKKVVRKIVTERRDYIKEKGIDALGPLMGLVMKDLRGKADGHHISRILREEIKKTISS